MAAEVVLDHQVLVDELCAVGVVGEDAAHLGRRDHHHGRLLGGIEGAYRRLVEQLEFLVGTGDDVRVATRLQPAVDARTDQATMAGDVDAILRGQVFTHGGRRSGSRVS